MKYALPRMVAACLALASAGCDSLATGAYRPSYFTIAGGFDTTLTTPSDVRLAILWFDDHSTRTNFAEQPVEVQTGVTTFKIQLTELPPPSVLHSLPPDQATQFGLDPAMRWADGTIVAYVDGDGDGRLDVAATTGASPDRIVGAASDLDVLYLASGQPAPPELIGLFPVTPGFSLVREPPPPSLPTPGQCGRFTQQGHFSDLCQPLAPSLPTALTPAEAITLTLVDDADQRYACASFWGPLEYPDWLRAAPDQICDGGACPFCRGYQCPLELPMAGDAVACAPDGLSYTFKRCMSDAALCDTTFCHFGHGERLAADPAPAGWPCP